MKDLNALALEYYDYHEHTGELSDIFDDDSDEMGGLCSGGKYCDSASSQHPASTNIKLKYLNEFFEVQDTTAHKYGVELKSYIFRSIDNELTLFMEFCSITNKRSRRNLEVHVVLYDKENDIICTGTNYIIGQDFTNFEVLKLIFADTAPSEIGRVVIYFQEE